MDDERRFVYTRRDLEAIAPHALRVGDWIAHAGPAGSGLFDACPVVEASPAGYSRTWREQTYRITYRTPTGLMTFTNPDHMRVYRLTSEAAERERTARRAEHEPIGGGR